METPTTFAGDSYDEEIEETITEVDEAVLLC